VGRSGGSPKGTALHNSPNHASPSRRGVSHMGLTGLSPGTKLAPSLRVGSLLCDMTGIAF
jgi:hypothetical protein